MASLHPGGEETVYLSFGNVCCSGGWRERNRETRGERQAQAAGDPCSAQDVAPTTGDMSSTAGTDA